MNPGLNSRSFWKIGRLRELIANATKQGIFTPFIAIAESWLKPFIPDAHLHLDNYHIFRADRLGPKNGGALLYIHNTIPIEKSLSYDDDTCNCVVCLSTVKKCIVASLYRPPNSSSESFSKVLNFLDEFITKCNNNNKLNIIVFGDFNFPGVRWDGSENFTCPSASISFPFLSSFISNHFLSQQVTKNTRLNNILDLLLTSDPHFVQSLQVEKTPLSDHNILKIYTSFFNNNIMIHNNHDESSSHDFNGLNMRTSNVAAIKQEFQSIHWESLMIGSIQDFPEKFNQTIYNTLRKHTKLKNKTKRRSIRNVHIRNRKIRKYNKKLLVSTNPEIA